jgi:hypothetical protein
VTRPSRVPAIQRLLPSRLIQTQMELMGADIDVQKLYLALGKNTIPLQEAVTDVEVDRTVEGASTVTVTVEDRDYALLTSGRLSSRNDIEIDGLFFRLAQVSIDGTTITLTFEDREIAVLRTYNKPIKQSLKTSRAQVTRARFVLRMIKEVKEISIPYFIPELNKVQPISGIKQLPAAQGRAANKTFGIPKLNALKVKGSQMTENQRVVANTILDVGSSKVLPRADLVMAIMTSIQESTLANLRMGSPGDFNYLGPNAVGNPVGAFQQIPKYWKSKGGASRDVAKDAAAFYDALVSAARGGGQYQNIIEKVQHSGNASAYAAWRTEAERIVNAYGVTDTAAASANNQWAQDQGNAVYEFYRGIPPTTTTRRQKFNNNWGREDSWTCIQRLASEVNWRAFFVSGKFYFLAEDDLFRSQPIATLDHSTKGVHHISGDYDEGKKTATLTLTVSMGRWQAPPGSVIQVQNMGPWDGRWLVNDVSRSLFQSIGTITLKKPMPRLPEPSGTNIVKLPGQQETWTGGFTPQDSLSQRQYHVGTALVQPVPQGFNNKIVQGVHATAGLTSALGNGPKDYLAIDFGASAGAPIVAVENGTIIRLSGHSPTLGAVDPALGVHGPFGWSVYLKGDSGATWYYTHMGTRQVSVGQKVLEGQVMGTVGNYAAVGGVNHVHLGVKSPSSGRPDVYDIMNAKMAVK